MGNCLNPGNAGYAFLRREPYFVDKTGLLQLTNKALNRDRCFLCVSRPRRFGKTLAAEMISSYYNCACDSSSLFDGLAISASPDYREHLNQYNVIQFSISSMDAALHQCQMKQKRSLHWDGPDWLSMNVVDYIDTVLIKELQAAFPQCFDPADYLVQILNSIRKNHATHPRFIFVIDEWDHIFRKYPNQPDLHKEYISFLESLFKHDFTRRCISLAYLTGICPIQQYGIQSELNVFDDFTMPAPLSMEPYMGFTEKEVASLCSRTSLSLDDMKVWYGGYRFNNSELSVYCPASVTAAVQYGESKEYWACIGSCDDIKTYINLGIIGLRPAIAQLLRGDALPCSTISYPYCRREPKTTDEVLTMLVHLGYLTFVQAGGCPEQVAIPNKEIRQLFQSSMTETPWPQTLAVLDRSALLLRSTWKRNWGAVAKQIQFAHLALTTPETYSTEEALLCVLQTAYQAARQYGTLRREVYRGFGCAGFVFEPFSQPDFSPAVPMLVELRENRSADSALARVLDACYTFSLARCPEVLHVRITYNPDTREHTCRMESRYPGTA